MSNPFRANNLRDADAAELHAILLGAGATPASRSQPTA
jgi:hypothetical protein